MHKELDVFSLPCPESETETSRKMNVGAERAVTVSAITGGGSCVGREGTLPGALHLAPRQ